MSLRGFLVMVTVLGAAGGAAAAGYSWVKGSDERRARMESARRTQDIRISLSEHLAQLDRPKLRSIVAGREVSTDLWEFRAATAEHEEKLSPAFGRAILHCDTAFARPECWTIAEITVDGELRFKLNQADFDIAKARRVAAPESLIDEPTDEAQPEAAAEEVIEEAIEVAAAENSEEPAAEATAEVEQPTGGAFVASPAAPVEAVAADEQDPAVQDPSIDAAAGTALPKVDIEPDQELAPSEGEEARLDASEAAETVADAAPVTGAEAAPSPETVAETEALAAAYEESALAPAAAPDAEPVETEALETKPVEAAPLETETKAEAEIEAGIEVGDEQAANESDTVAEPEAETEAQPVEIAANEIAEPEPTHIVRVSEVNARSAPGKSGQVLAIVSRGQELHLVDQRGRWGYFELVGGDNDGKQLWIYDRLVSPAG